MRSEYRSVPRCPRCARPLQFLAIPVGNARGCDGCSGVLLDDEAFGFVRTTFYENISRSAEVPVDLVPWDESAVLRCPLCEAPMRRTELEGVAIDFCKEHGTWFDARELVAVAVAIQRRHADGTAPPDYGFVPWAASPKTAEVLADLNERLRHNVDGVMLAETVRHLQRRWR